MPPGQIGGPRTSLSLLHHANDLLYGEPRSLLPSILLSRPDIGRDWRGTGGLMTCQANTFLVRIYSVNIVLKKGEADGTAER